MRLYGSAGFEAVWVYSVHLFTQRVAASNQRARGHTAPIRDPDRTETKAATHGWLSRTNAIRSNRAKERRKCRQKPVIEDGGPAGGRPFGGAAGRIC